MKSTKSSNNTHPNTTSGNRFKLGTITRLYLRRNYRHYLSIFDDFTLDTTTTEPLCGPISNLGTVQLEYILDILNNWRRPL